MLTHESGNDADAGDPEHVKLEDEIRTIFGEQLDEPPVAEDGLKPKP